MPFHEDNSGLTAPWPNLRNAAKGSRRHHWSTQADDSVGIVTTSRQHLRDGRSLPELSETF